MAPFDAGKLNALPVVADARAALGALTRALGRTGYSSGWGGEVEQARGEWSAEVDRLYAAEDPAGLSQTRCLGELNERLLPKNAIVVGASGSLPGDLQRVWRPRRPGGYHMEYGFSCMGYEIAAALGAKLAEPEREVFALVGDGSYVMLHSELLTSLQEGLKINVVVFDNQGFQCIDNLQTEPGHHQVRQRAARPQPRDRAAHRRGPEPGLRPQRRELRRAGPVRAQPGGVPPGGPQGPQGEPQHGDRREGDAQVHDRRLRFLVAGGHRGGLAQPAGGGIRRAPEERDRQGPEAMTPKERIVAAIQGREVDRLPWCPFFTYWWDEQPEARQKAGQPAFYREIGADALLRGPTTAFTATDLLGMAEVPLGASYNLKDDMGEATISRRADGGHKYVSWETPVGRLEVTLTYSPQGEDLVCLRASRSGKRTTTGPCSGWSSACGSPLLRGGARPDRRAGGATAWSRRWCPLS